MKLAILRFIASCALAGLCTLPTVVLGIAPGGWLAQPHSSDRLEPHSSSRLAVLESFFISARNAFQAFAAYLVATFGSFGMFAICFVFGYVATGLLFSLGGIACRVVRRLFSKQSVETMAAPGYTMEKSGYILDVEASYTVEKREIDFNVTSETK
ncbi:hypothetical protein MVEN_00851500 [Mycena venus]|uniref:Uncharacterized protein n=1 Tax=Mycena venus TaxID=2733690 RepID=A0A8H6YE41_9AGAR|nr:hypothetical protein MVEN_00851500 [Mycena venus]